MVILLTKTKSSVVVVSETWLSHSTPDSLIRETEAKIFRYDREANIKNRAAVRVNVEVAATCGCFGLELCTLMLLPGKLSSWCRLWVTWYLHIWLWTIRWLDFRIVHSRSRNTSSQRPGFSFSCLQTSLSLQPFSWEILSLTLSLRSFKTPLMGKSSWGALDKRYIFCSQCSFAENFSIGDRQTFALKLEFIKWRL